MNNATVKQAAAEARRFLGAVADWTEAEKDKGNIYCSNPKESGAVRRASMDLTRALAQLRKPG